MKNDSNELIRKQTSVNKKTFFYLNVNWATSNPQKFSKIYNFDYICHMKQIIIIIPRPSLAIFSFSHSVSDWSFPELPRTTAESARLKV